MLNTTKMYKVQVCSFNKEFYFKNQIELCTKQLSIGTLIQWQGCAN